MIATMNPSGDYGKKELSPALRNRFTEIWVEPITHPEFIIGAREDVLSMIRHKLAPLDPSLAGLIFDFMAEYNCKFAPRYGLSRKLLTMRDIGWICTLINQSQLPQWQLRYLSSIRILA